MKNLKLFWGCVAGACLASLICEGAARGYAAPDAVRWSAKKGNWKDGRNWDTSRVPSGFVIASVRTPATITLDSAVPEVFSFGVGAAGAGAFWHIETGAKLRAQGSVSVFLHENNSKAFAEMTGGEIEVGLNTADYAAFGVGSSSTFSATGAMTMSGGIIKGGLVVGSPYAGQGTGLFVLQGSAPRVVANGNRATFMINPTGTMRFVCDAAGVGVLDYEGKTVSFKPGAKLEVDASAYRGPSKRLPLVLAGRLDGAEALDIKVLNAPAGATAKVVLEPPPSKKIGIFLEIKRKS